MKKGEIFVGTKRGRDAARHPIIFLKDRGDGSFIGAILTHGKNERYPDNVSMQAKHFAEKYELNFDDTYLVGRRFIKPKDWGPFKKVGELTKEGIEFVGSITTGHNPISWDDYYDDQR